MKRIASILLLAGVVRAADLPPKVEVATVPFEPAREEFFEPKDKFAHPPEVVAPVCKWPFEFRRGGGAVADSEVVVLVQLDGKGRAKVLRVLASPYESFSISTIDALKKARWDSSRSCWFYYRHVYTLEN
jgi:hypothetical protein